jgi:hypothetical protein
MVSKRCRSGATKLRRAALATAIASLFAAPVSHAFEVDTGNEDITMRWDNTVRYNLGIRAQSQNSQILGNPNYDDGDRNFSNVLGGNKGAGNWSAGVAADVYQKYKFQLSYNGYYGNYSTDPTGATPAGGVMGVPNGTTAALSDRG